MGFFVFFFFFFFFGGGGGQNEIDKYVSTEPDSDRRGGETNRKTYHCVYRTRDKARGGARLVALPDPTNDAAQLPYSSNRKSHGMKQAELIGENLP